MTDMVQQLLTMRSKRKRQEEEPPCGKHSQRLALFCERGLELLCPQCRVSSDHQYHRLMPVEQAAARNRRKLKSYIKPLKKETEHAKMRYEVPILRSLNVKRKMATWRKELQSEFKEIKSFLVKKQAAIHARLLTEEKDVKEKLTENQRQISDHLSTLQNLLNEVTEKCFRADLDVLTGIENIYNTYDNLKTPAVFSYESKKESLSFPPHYFGLQRIISTFQDLILDPETAHPSLIISRDRKSVIFRIRKPHFTDNPQSFSFYPAVRSCEGFDAGRHFWQVEMRGTGACSLGGCKHFPEMVLHHQLHRWGAGKFSHSVVHVVQGIQKSCKLAFFWTMSWEKFHFII
ncbi:tripartite motif-containing protein 60-like [Symphalangus syndactylus]|uniref:tripartite motif-containing protein 60-like n=1 Tax=Symphalangus syndactylus TaxID=9590 RepID=UPI003006B1E7